MAVEVDSSATGSASWRRDLLCLAIGFAVLFFFRLGSYPLANPDEGRNAEIPREMVASGDWVTPRLDGVNYFEKPPLVYWTTALAMETLGTSEWALRATPAFFALFGVLITYGAARQLYGRLAGLLAAVVLGTSLLYFALAHILVLDMAVSVLMSATLFCFLLAVRRPAAEGGARRWYFYGLYASAALATLTKGMIGFLVTGAVMFLWLLIFNQWRRLRPMYLPTGMLLFLAIALPWHLFAAAHNPTWFHRYIVFEHFERFLTPAASRPGPVWYFVPIVIGGLFPWIGFLWPASRLAMAGGWRRRSEYAEGWFLLTWSVFIFLFFSKSQSKLPPYILPIFPALAVLIGRWLALRLAAGSAAPFRVPWRIFSFLCGLIAVALVVVVLRPALAKLTLSQADELRIPAYAMAALLLVGGVVVPWLAVTRNGRQAIVTTALVMVAFYGALQCADLPEVIKPGTKTLALYVKAHARPTDRVMHYHEFFHDFPFYAGRLVDLVAFKGELELEEDPRARQSGRFIDEATFRRLWDQPGRIFVVARKRDVDPHGRDPALFADPTFHYRVLAETEDHYLISNHP